MCGGSLPCEFVVMLWCFAAELWWIATLIPGEGCVFIGDL
jgi:hypothetical protein